MTRSAAESWLPPLAAREKRRQILEGARSVFLGSGFDGASMGEIARAAGVSKGTLYVYFASKDELFGELLREKTGETAERCFVLDPDGDVRAELTALARRYLAAMTEAENIATLRLVIGVAEKFPTVGEAYLEAGTGQGVARLSAWIRHKNAAGELDVEDPEITAWHFICGCYSKVVLPMLFCGGTQPDPADSERVVHVAVESFIRAYAATA